MVALLTVVSVLFAASAQATTFTPRDILSGLRARQTANGIDPSAFPAQCQSGCTTSLNTISSCTDMTCICTSANINGIQSCINCIVSTAPTADVVSEGQSVINSFNQECAGQGVASLTFGSAGGSSATAAGSSASATSANSKSAAGQVGVSMAGFIGAGILGSLVAVF